MLPILHSADELLAKYDVVFCDVWGVVHNGVTAYREACAALERFRRKGGTVALVSNAPRRPASVEGVLAEKSVPPSCWDVIVSSGGIAVTHAAEKGYGQVYHLGPDRDLDIFDDTGLERVAIEDCDAILCTGLVDDRRETGEDYRERLIRAAGRKLPFICANPDLVVDVGAQRLPCAGAIAAVYEDLGGPVFWAGKPYKSSYEAAMTSVSTWREAAVHKSQVLAIGDSVRTDMAGAAAFGIDALFIGQGIHHDTIAPHGALDAAALADLLAAEADFERMPVAAMMTLC